ncbi:MAG: iron ABC transporter permease, partial [Paracoccaceae bacterium]|nr:iron ABC transporter permease [Paracoccaceae bacterium]
MSPPNAGLQWPFGAVTRGHCARFAVRFAMPTVGAGVVTLLVAYPLLSFLALAVFPHLFGQGGEGASVSFTAFGDALSGYNLRSLLNSLWIGAGAGVIGTVFGTWLSFLTTRTTLAGRHLIEAAVWAVLLLPSYFMAVGWQLLLAPGGIVSIPWLSDIILGPVGVMIVLGLKGIPFAYLTLVAAWQALPEDIDEAGRVHGCSARTRLKLSLGLLLPGIIAAFAMIYAESLADFGVAATLAAGVNFPLATYAIYAALSTMPLNFSLAAANSWLLLALVLPAVWLQTRVNKRAERYRVITGRARPARRRVLTLQRAGLHLVGVVAILFLALGVPIFAAAVTSLIADQGKPLSLSNLTLGHYRDVLRLPEVFGALLYSARLAIVSALGALLLGLGLTLALMRQSRVSRILDLGLLTIMALPGLILAAGYIFAFNQAWLPLYGTSLLLVMAYVT